MEKIEIRVDELEVWEGPTDILGIGMYNSLSNRMKEDPKYRQFINNLEIRVVLDVGYYPVMIKFEKNSFEITRDIENPDLTIKIEAQSMFDLTEGKMSMIGLFLRRKLKIKPFFKIFSAYKIFSKIF